MFQRKVSRKEQNGKWNDRTIRRAEKKCNSRTQRSYKTIHEKPRKTTLDAVLTVADTSHVQLAATNVFQRRKINKFYTMVFLFIMFFHRTPAFRPPRYSLVPT